ncbi:AAA domain-containing protein [Candidatus Caldatribacterium sp.]|uniref:AAA domain-containing protein n=1 Tax=Candidatus Caldatribacterium sp. TaxID=2282143 RepID=UPI002993E6A6|nr:AAA domain-containing protein [Candidatus Caldatribacterium sp.]MDW8082102.1 AAA domain-containing protein [Candidatus Calescibacterium sp.]
MNTERTILDATLREQQGKTQREYTRIRLSPSGKETCLLSSYPEYLAKRYPRSLVSPTERLNAFLRLYEEGILPPLVETLVSDEDIVFVEKRLDMNLKTFVANGGDPLALFPTLVAKLYRLQEHIHFHGNLKPTNILITSGEVFLDDPYPGGDPSFWRHEAHFAAPECIVGQPQRASDWWALGMILLNLFGKDPFEGVASNVVAFLLVTRPITISKDFPPRLQALLRGLLTRDTAQRLGYEAILRWIQGEELVIASEPEKYPSVEPFVFGNISVTTPEEFAQGVICGEELWNLGKQELRQGYFIGWLRSILGREDLAQDLENILLEEADDDYALFQAILRLTPDIPFAFCGRVLAYCTEEHFDITPLARLLESWVNGNEDTPGIRKIVHAVVEKGLFSAYLKEKQKVVLIPHIRECEERAQEGQTLEEKAAIYCAYLVGHPELTQHIVTRTRRKRAEELYTKVRSILQSSKSLRSRCYELWELLGSVPKELETEVAHAHQLLEGHRITQEVFRGVCSLTLRAIAQLTGVEPPQDLKELAQFRLPPVESVEAIINIPDAKVIATPKNNQVPIHSKTHGEMRLVFSDSAWSPLLSMLSEGDTLAVFSVRHGNIKGFAFAQRDTVVVLEPNFLVELSDLAKTCNARELRPWLFFFSRCIPQEFHVQALYGTLVARLVATSFDRNETPENVLQRLLEEDPLAFFPLGTSDLQTVQNELLAHYRKVQSFLAGQFHDALLSEENMLSESLGLMGRADILLRQGSLWKVVEIKTTRKYPYRSPWPEHHAQVAGYYAIAKSSRVPLANEAVVLYTAAPLPEGAKNLSITEQDQRNLIHLRNMVVSLWKRVEKEPLETIAAILEQRETIASHVREGFERFRRAFTAALPLARRYYAQMLAFLFREERTARSELFAGSFISLWRQNLEDQEHQITTLPDLLWENVDLKKGLFTFRIDTHEDYHADFRAGDRVLLMPQEGEKFFLSGYLEYIDSTTVVVRALSRQAFLHHLQERKGEHLLMEHDLSVRYKAVMQSLFLFLEAPPQKQELLLGLCKPRFGPVAELPLPAELRADQVNVLRRAFSAQDYFLIQGPPGTGKTKIILANLVRLFLSLTNERLLLLAFTNRAVDEMCEAVKNAAPEHRFLRLGSTILTEHRDCIPQEIFKGKTPQEMQRTIENMRVLVSTIDSCLDNWEVIARFSPTVAIVDEASQLLEPQLAGILSVVQRFILIGDERQLPAVTVQPHESLYVSDEELRRIGITNFGMSLFERLLRNAQRKGWQECFGNLCAQGRMHRDIQDFANVLAYSNTLRTVCAEQETPITGYAATSADPVERLLAKSRVLFIPVPEERVAPRVNRTQVRVAVRFVETIARLSQSTPKSIGIIAPFRAQVHALRKALKKEWNAFVQVDTVERFQGTERDVIILSLSVNSPKQLQRIQSFPPEPFLSGRSIVDRRLNVAITRAREHLIVLGSPAVLFRSAQYREFLELIREKGGYVDDNATLIELWGHTTNTP